MSIALMTQAFKTSLPSTQKFVLVALCDSANDQGECYPSITTLMAKCSLSDRGVQKAIGELQTGGYITRDLRNGRSTLYLVTPERGAPRTTFPPNDVHPTPERGSPITINEPSVEPPKKQKSKPDLTVGPLELVAAGFDMATAEEFIAVKANRKAPLTPRAWADHLREAAKAGWTPMAAAEKVMAKTWKGFEASYVANERSAGGKPFQTAKERDTANAAAWAHKTTGGLLGADAFAPDNVIEMEIRNAARIESH